ncbi:MAG: tetratricopeptide repeat protein [Saprospiraceae bacterium]|nr:tetratricopeptide repeat protein [Saprospiraceae bacterium]
MKTLWKVNSLLFLCLALLFTACDYLQMSNQMEETDPNIKALLEEGEDFFAEEDFESAIERYEAVLDKLPPQENCKTYPQVLLQLGKSNFKLQRYYEALDYYHTYLELPQIQSSSEDKAKGLNNIAAVHQRIGNEEESYRLQLEALEILESIQDSAGIGRALYQLGTIVFYQKNYKQALKYYQGSLALAEERKKDKAMLSCYSALGPTYAGLGDTLKAHQYLTKALALSRSLKSRSKEAYALHNLGAHYLKKKELDKALNALMESYHIKVELQDKWGLIGSHMYLGDVYMKQKRLALADTAYQEGLALADEIDSDRRRVALYKRLAKVASEQKDFRRAFSMNSEYIDLKETLLNEEMIKNASNARIKYELSKKENEIQLLKQENRFKKSKSTFYWAMSFLTVCLMGMSYRSVIKHRFQIQLQEKNEEINQQYTDLSRKNEDLQKFAFIVSHDLKAPLRTIGSFTGLLRRRYFNAIDKNGQEYMEFITGGVKRMDQLLNDLLTYSQIENKPQESDWTETKDVVHNALSNLYFQIRNENAAIRINENALPRVKGNSAHLTQLFQNIIANGIKFRNGKSPQISIDCVPEEHNYTFKIRDNGIGIEEQYREKIFRMFSRLHKMEEYEGTGIGLATCKKIVERHGGEIWVESKLGQGSTFCFSLPRN